jgi:hypothetical protein
MKAHMELLVYNMTNDDIDRINYQVRDATKDTFEEATKKQEELHQQV